MGIKYPVKVHGWHPVLLSHYSRAQLGALIQIVMDEHTNDRNEAGLYIENGQPTIHILDKKGRRKLDALTWALIHKDRRELRQPLRCHDKGINSEYRNLRIPGCDCRNE
ncbi:hypothetical protein PN823_004487 [Enterobacter hormaechei]|nr:hypothetical protein [Enterobacter hormaechei]